MNRKIGRHKTVVREHGFIVLVRYHRTYVVRIDYSKLTVRLESGGWRTATTKKRMNEAALQYQIPFWVYQRNFDWFVSLPNGAEVPFEEDMEIDF